jgi:hypothetical protein
MASSRRQPVRTHPKPAFEMTAIETKRRKKRRKRKAKTADQNRMKRISLSWVSPVGEGIV